MDEIVINLPGAPQGKGRPRFVRATGHAFTPAKTRSYESLLQGAAFVAMNGRSPLGGPVSVAVLACFPVPASWPRKRREAALTGDIRPTTKPDADNLLKVLDAMNAVVFQDDKQIVSANIEKRYSAEPRLEVRVRGR